MQWEYAWMWLEINDNITIRYSHAEEEVYKKPKRLEPVLKRLGDEGWELVTAERIITGSPGQTRFWFKRPRSQQ